MSMWVRYIFRATAVALTLIVLGCNGGDLCSYEEVSRTSSPDEAVDAVVMLKKCGATVSDSYRIYVIKKGEAPNLDDESSVFVSDKTDDINVRWKGDKQLSISYAKARIFHFKNFWQSKEVDGFRYVVSITEKIEEPSTSSAPE